MTNQGAGYCWGNNDFGKLGADMVGAASSVPVPVAGGHVFRSISAGQNHSCAIDTGNTACALDANGGLYCWGNNGSGQLAGTATATCTIGLSDTVPCANAPIVSAAGLSFSAISAGAFHTCAIGLAGGAYCWGANDYAQIGNGSAGAPVTAPFHLVDPSID